MRTRSFSNIENKQARKKARKDYYKLRRAKKKQRDLIKNKERNEKNKKYKILIKRNSKKIGKILKEKSPNQTDLEKLFRQAQKYLDKAVQKGIIHKNKANRKKKKSRQKINQLIKQNINNQT